MQIKHGMKLWVTLSLGIAVVLIISGCSGVKTYRGSSPENMTVSTEAREDWLMHRLSLELYIYAVNEKCEHEYEGTRLINEPETRFGVPVNQTKFLEFIFVKYPIMSGGVRYVTKEGTLFRAKEGMTYDVDVYYDNGVYDVSIAERNPATGKTSSVPFVSMGQCR